MILAYAAGILILALCIAAAWFLPEIYGKWQDQRLIGQVQLSDREEIDFLDGDILDQIARWQELEACADFFWENGEEWYSAIETDWDGYMDACEEEAETWRDSGLLPLPENKLDFRGKSTYFYECRTLLAGENTIPVVIFSFSLSNDFAADEDDGCVTIVLDIETKKAYYISVTGIDVREYMAEQLGYLSLEDMSRKLVESGRKVNNVSPDTSGMNFAAVCGADAASVTAYPGSLELDVEVGYDSFKAKAQRRVIVGENYMNAMGTGQMTGYGLAVMFGPTSNPEVFAECLYLEGTDDYWQWRNVDWLDSTEIFCDVLYSEEVYSDEADAKEDGIIVFQEETETFFRSSYPDSQSQP